MSVCYDGICKAEHLLDQMEKQNDTIYRLENERKDLIVALSGMLSIFKSGTIFPKVAINQAEKILARIKEKHDG